MHRRARAKNRSRSRASGRSHWTGIALLGALALAVIGGRDAFLPMPSVDWLMGLIERPPIRAGMNVRAERTDCRLARVVDGDTVDFDCPDEGVIRARLLGFDTPEVYSPKCASELALGRQATASLEEKISRATELRMVFSGSDKYDRRLTRLYLDGADVAGAMVTEGLARPYDGGRRRGWCG